MIALRLKRDEARMVERDWLPYLTAVAAAKMRHHAGNKVRYLNWKMILSLLTKMELSFKRKLLSGAVKFKFNLDDAEASAFYLLLMRLPIEEHRVYEIWLRQKIADFLFKELIVHE